MKKKINIFYRKNTYVLHSHNIIMLKYVKNKYNMFKMNIIKVNKEIQLSKK